MTELTTTLSSVLDSPRSALDGPPSRHSNPFSTCWTRPGALPFVFPDGETAAGLVARLAANRWWGEIVGPHGSGKTTLVESLKPALQAAGRCTHSIALRDRQRCLPRDFLRDLRQIGPQPLAIVDGYEQLGRLQRLWLKHRCRQLEAGLLITTHAPAGLATLISLTPDAELVARLVDALCGRGATSIAPTDVTASLACHGSNVREVFFDLYDRHERRRTAR